MSGLSKDDIEYVLKLIDQSEIDELKLEMGDFKLELRRNGAAPIAEQATTKASPAPAASAPTAPTPQTPTTSSSDIDVPSPLLGTFYHASKPGEPPFVKLGDTVTPDTVIGIVEVMKLMNQVTAECSGVVTEIVAPNGELVEHGQVLIRVNPA